MRQPPVLDEIIYEAMRGIDILDLNADNIHKL
jgi:hypothetical protein